MVNTGIEPTNVITVELGTKKAALSQAAQGQELKTKITYLLEYVMLFTECVSKGAVAPLPNEFSLIYFA